MFLIIIISAILILSMFVLCLDCNPRLWFCEKFGAKPEAKLRGKVVWITGASSGIGEHLAYELAKCGCKLVLSARRKAELERVKEGCVAYNKEKFPDATAESHFLVLPIDMSDFQSHKALTKPVLQHFHKIDVLVNNAGMLQVGLAEHTKLSVDQRVMDVNFLGVLSLTKAVLPHFLEKEDGHVTVISSPGGKLASATMALYCASKFAIEGYFQALRQELSSKNIKVTVVCPGLVKSQVLQNALAGDTNQLFIDKVKAGSNGDTQDTVIEGYREMSADRCARLIAVALANELNEVVMACQDFLIFFYVALYCPWLVKGIAAKMQQPRVKELRKKKEKEKTS
ncbi:dehydrogenase/reductase SDR family member 7-like isoform X1 [Oculina patagonica]